MLILLVYGIYNTLETVNDFIINSYTHKKVIAMKFIELIEDKHSTQGTIIDFANNSNVYFKQIDQIKNAYSSIKDRESLDAFLQLLRKNIGSIDQGSKLVLSSWKALADKQGYDTDAVGNSIEAISSFHNAAKSSGILTEKVDVLNALKTLSTVWEYLAKTLANIEVPSDRIKTKFVRIANYANSSAKEIYAVAEQAFQDRQGKTSDQSQAA